MLRAHADEARAMARRLVAADGILADEEMAALQAIEEALSGRDA